MLPLIKQEFDFGLTLNNPNYRTEIDGNGWEAGDILDGSRWDSSSGTVAIDASTKFSGSFSLKCTGGGSYVTKIFSKDTSSIFFDFIFGQLADTADQGIFKLLASDNTLILGIHKTGSSNFISVFSDELSLTLVSGTVSIADSLWHRAIGKIRIHPTQGIIDMKIYDTAGVIEDTLYFAGNTGNLSAGKLRLGYPWGTAGILMWVDTALIKIT